MILFEIKLYFPYTVCFFVPILLVSDLCRNFYRSSRGFKLRRLLGFPPTQVV